MLYATGGVAYARFTGTATLTCPVCDPATISAAKVKAGWVVGGGVEAALAYNWTWKIEYLRADYGTINTTAELPGITNVAGELAKRMTLSELASITASESVFQAAA